MDVSFCDKWFRYQKKIIGPLSWKKAKKMDEKGKSYTVIIGNQMHPYCFIEVGLGCYGVRFLDEMKREYLSYTFEEQEDGMLFLIEAIYRKFDGESDTVTNGEVYWFSTDGTVKIDKSKPTSEKAVILEKKADVSKNWEKKPEFGKYENLIKKDR